MTEPMSTERLEELEKFCLTSPTFKICVLEALQKIDESCQEIRRLWAENDRLRQDRSDALNVKSREGLLSSEWIARTGKAERRAKELEAEITKLREFVESVVCVFL